MPLGGTIIGTTNRGHFVAKVGPGNRALVAAEVIEEARKVLEQLQVHALIVIGGDGSMTTALQLQEAGINCIGVPKTIDGDLKHPLIPMTFGFDTATKTYSELIGNIERDVLSSGKYYHFIKLMGRSASHVTLECALQTQPNWTLIGEEIAEKKIRLTEIVDTLVTLIIERAASGFPFGVFLIPEGLIEFIPECRQLIDELDSKNQRKDRRG